MSNDRRPMSSDELIRQAKESLKASSQELAQDSSEADLPDVPGESTLVTPDVERPTFEPRLGRRPSLRPQPPAPVAGPFPNGARRGSRAVVWALAGVMLVGIAAVTLMWNARQTSSGEASPTVEAGLRDDFDGELAPGWVWVGEDSDRWSVTRSPGALLIEQAPAGSTTPPVWKNVLLRSPNADTYEITTSIDFRPTDNFQSAGLIVWEDESNLLSLVRAFCDLCISGGGDGVYFDNVVDRGVPENQGPRAVNTDDVVFLRIQADDDTYVGSYSLDHGETWRPAGTITRSLTSPRVGILVNRNDPKAPLASFDFFELTS